MCHVCGISHSGVPSVLKLFVPHWGRWVSVSWFRKQSLCDVKPQGMEVPDVASFSSVRLMRLSLSFTHTHTHTKHKYRVSLFGFCMSDCTVPPLMLRWLEMWADLKGEEDGGRNMYFLSRYFSTFTWMYIYCLKTPVFLSRRWLNRIVFIQFVITSELMPYLNVLTWQNKHLDLTSPNVVACAAFCPPLSEEPCTLLWCKPAHYLLRSIKCHCV